MPYSKSCGMWPEILVLIWNGCPTLRFQNFVIPPSWISLHYMSIITEDFRYFMPISHGVNRKTPPSACRQLPPPHQVFTRVFVVLQEALYQLFQEALYQPYHFFFSSDQIICEIFKGKQFFFSTDCLSVLILLFCLCVFYGVFYSSVIMKLRFSFSSNHVT